MRLRVWRPTLAGKPVPSAAPPTLPSAEIGIVLLDEDQLMSRSRWRGWSHHRVRRTSGGRGARTRRETGQDGAELSEKGGDGVVERGGPAQWGGAWWPELRRRGVWGW